MVLWMSMGMLFLETQTQSALSPTLEPGRIDGCDVGGAASSDQ